ncbi:MAG: phosphomethylpyrimidine synthase ThiC [Candidatus Euphemobacter frigidus]|nr:phosphomethylpyrimidine synthase ThiC [Candidatus Euphemobacter frigidus]MDP8274930.1 phosphomethylpyrimidine synthase ThiC [Candidatus Euphemobacter frigidus]
MSVITEAKRGKPSPEVEAVAREEHLPVEDILRGLAEGTIVVPANRSRKIDRPCGIGKGLKVKVNANIGTSRQELDYAVELEKLAVAVAAGADTVMDLSTGGDIRSLRERILNASPVPVGTVPIYEAAIEAGKHKGRIVRMTGDEMLEVIEDQARQGVDYMTVHVGVTLRTLEVLRQSPRLLGVVSRGGSFLLEWMLVNEKENPLYARFDELLEIAHRYDVTLSLGDGLRPGCLADATDRPQIQELIILGELAERCRQAEVQVMIEGPGHIPLDQIAENVRLEKSLCRGAPFYVLGPLVTDVAPGYDHITCAIGGALAAYLGTDFLCYVTPSEHLGLPSVEDVKDGVMATRIAAHAADVARGLPGARDWDDRISRYRKARDWKGQVETALDPQKAREYLGDISKKEDYCSMCSEYCAIKILEKYLGGDPESKKE